MARPSAAVAHRVDSCGQLWSGYGRALRPSSVQALESWGFRVHEVDVDELEKGGGSLRCLIAEIF